MLLALNALLVASSHPLFGGSMVDLSQMYGIDVYLMFSSKKTLFTHRLFSIMYLIDICPSYSVQSREITGSHVLPGTWTIKYMSVITLIKRGGGKRPDEARQPAVQTGRVPIPAVHAMPQDEGTVQNVQPLQKGVFLCLKIPSAFLFAASA